MESRYCDSNAEKVKLNESVRKSLAEIHGDELGVSDLLLGTCSFFSNIGIGSKLVSEIKN